ncbi:FKBP-type peptidyl-prolyl cis-trans isomerase [Candidatus Pacearchaeota archaeon]|nr:FKBP-type peptidyl-prolyl cis-trans isomerase [Candidatus Pacearchaeota archaeon]
MDMQANNLTKKGDFVEIKFTGLVDGKVFDSNIPEDLKQLNDKAVPEKTIVIIGQKMVVKGLDEHLEGEELNKNYSISIKPKDAFGSRKIELVRTMPLRVFNEQKIQPVPGASFIFDNKLAKVIAVSGARVTTDFNNPLAGKEVTYKFTISQIVSDLKEKAETVCKLIFRHIPEIEIVNNEITIKGPKILGNMINQNQSKFKEFLGKEVSFKESENQKDTKSQ